MMRKVRGAAAGRWLVLAVSALLAVGLLAGRVFAAAPTLGDARAAYFRHDYAAEMGILLPLAEQGNGVAENNLATMYALGQGIPPDPVQAYRWFSLAAINLPPSLRAMANTNRDRIALTMNPDQISAAQKLVSGWTLRR